MTKTWKCTLFILIAAGLVFGASTLSAQEAVEPEAPEAAKDSAGIPDGLSIGIFADAYASLNYIKKGFAVGANDGVRAYDSNNGFGFHWAGIDMAYEKGQAGATIALRFGPGADTYNGLDGGLGGGALKQAYATWAPTDMISIDIGKFDTIFGAEVAESQNNINYNRGLVYWLAQPLFHTGLRANMEFGDFGVTAMVVNGWNNSVDNNNFKSVALQGSYSTDLFSVYLGAITGAEDDQFATSDDGAVAEDEDYAERLKTLVDLVATVDLGDLTLVLNGDVGFQDNGEDTLMWWGAMLGAQYKVNDLFAAAIRGEIFGDADGWANNIEDLSLASATLTFDYLPTENLMLRLDNRLDMAFGAEGDASKIFQGDEEMSDMGFTTTLGAIVFTN